MASGVVFQQQEGKTNPANTQYLTNEVVAKQLVDGTLMLVSGVFNKCM